MAQKDDGKWNFFSFEFKQVVFDHRKIVFDFFNFNSKASFQIGNILTRCAQVQRITKVIWIQKIMKM